MKLNGVAIRTIRERSGISATALANRAGISQVHMTNIELGKRQASPALTRKLAKILKIDLLAILADPEPNGS